MIKVLKNIEDILEFNNNYKNSIGFVPTMGNLHAGHISLVERSFQDNDTTVVSIFVNPKQFGESKDFKEYPKTFQDDSQKIKQLHNKYKDRHIYILSPIDESIIYPKDFSDYISVNSLNSISEGKTRPGHFDGVATVVNRLFKLVKPTKAYFGKKDYQQYLLVTKMVDNLKLNIEIIGMPIVREQDGLAMSSRNSRLDTVQRQDSLLLSKTLLATLFELQTKGLVSAQNKIKETLRSDQRFNYLEIRNTCDFEIARETEEDFVILGNFQLGDTRLLDNIEVTR